MAGGASGAGTAKKNRAKAATKKVKSGIDAGSKYTVRKGETQASALARHKRERNQTRAAAGASSKARSLERRRATIAAKRSA